ncbi:MAG TPA: OB-fold domain-containing protein [Acidimicrobiales bacterium]|nr:OB-fold domain-containing protein [Acidimicrobiales bacterium]
MHGTTPPLDSSIAPFWDGTRDRQLLLPRCTHCDDVFWYPRPTCPRCLHADLDWIAAAGTGTVHAVSAQARGDDPYAVVLVELDESVRIMSNTTTTDVAIGDRVRITWEALEDGRHLWLFEPAD